MPDIAMCKGCGCPQRERCHRYTAAPSRFQTFYAIPPYDHVTGECHAFVPAREPRRVRGPDT